MAIDHSTSLPIFRDVVDDLRDFVHAIYFVADVAEMILSDTLSPEVIKGRTLPIELLAEGISSRIDLLARFDELLAPYRRDQEALALVIKAAAEAETSPAELLRYTFGTKDGAGT